MNQTEAGLAPADHPSESLASESDRHIQQVEVNIEQLSQQLQLLHAMSTPDNLMADDHDTLRYLACLEAATGLTQELLAVLDHYSTYWYADQGRAAIQSRINEALEEYGPILIHRVLQHGDQANEADMLFLRPFIHHNGEPGSFRSEAHITALLAQSFVDHSDLVATILNQSGSREHEFDSASDDMLTTLNSLADWEDYQVEYAGKGHIGNLDLTEMAGLFDKLAIPYILQQVENKDEPLWARHGQMIDSRGTAEDCQRWVDTVSERVLSQPNQYLDDIKYHYSHSDGGVRLMMDEVISQTLRHHNLDPELWGALWMTPTTERQNDPNDQVEAIRDADLLFESWRTACQLEHQHKGAVVELFDQFGVSNISRYPTKMLINQLNEPPKSGQPYGVMLYPYADHNGAFRYKKEVLEGFQSSVEPLGKVVIYEAGDTLDVVHYINVSRKKYGKMQFAIIGGHGTKDDIQFGMPQPFDSDASVQKALEKTFLSSEMVQRSGANIVSQAFTDNPEIALVSCSTGQEGGIAEEISAQINGATVSAPDIDTNITELKAFKRFDGAIGLHIAYWTDTKRNLYQYGSKVEQDKAVSFE